MVKLPWLIRIIILGVCTIAGGMLPVLALMWANYHYDPNVFWPNEYGGWYIVPMLFIGAGWGLGVNLILEKYLKVCSCK